jgi:NADPH-dependent ferric siderophore reductase
MTIEQIKAANHRAGRFFFEPATMRFFRSRVGSTVYEGPGGVYFVTSEQFVPSSGRPHPRLYTVRQFDPATGDVDSVGEFNELTKGRAHRAARKLAAGIPAPA